MKNIKEMLESLFFMQKTANDLTNGENWIEDYTEDGLEINWSRCMRMELSEAVDQSFNWKHWKNTTNGQYSFIENGLSNVKVEVIDVLHFLMSEIIKQDWIKDFIKNFDEKVEVYEKSSFSNNKELIIDLENLERTVFRYEDDNTFNNMEILFNKFWELALKLTSFEDIHNIYVLKNTLNIFRQKNGYKSGTYIKNWGINEIEDNVFLNEYLQDEGVIEYKEIDLYLTKKYKELNTK